MRDEFSVFVIFGTVDLLHNSTCTSCESLRYYEQRQYASSGVKLQPTTTWLDLIE
jgi:hypothetical protein